MAASTGRSQAGESPPRQGGLITLHLDPRHIPGQRALRRRALRSARREARDESGAAAPCGLTGRRPPSGAKDC